MGRNISDKRGQKLRGISHYSIPKLSCQLRAKERSEYAGKNKQPSRKAHRRPRSSLPKKDKVKLSVVSQEGEEAVLAILGVGELSTKDVRPTTSSQSPMS